MKNKGIFLLLAGAILVSGISGIIIYEEVNETSIIEDFMEEFESEIEYIVGFELGNSRVNNIVGSVYTTLWNPSYTLGILVFEVIVSEFMLSEYLGLTVDDLYLKNGSSKIFLQSKYEDSTTYAIMYKESENWKIHPYYQDLENYDWVIPEILKINA